MELIDHEVLAELMARKGCSVRSLAAEVGTSHGTIGSLSSGKRPTCKGDLGPRIERALNVLPGTLFCHAGTVSRLMGRKTPGETAPEAQVAEPEGDVAPANLPRLTWTVAEVSHMLGIPKTTVRGLIHRNEIRSIRPGRDYLVPDSELKRYVEQPLAPERVSA